MGVKREVQTVMSIVIWVSVFDTDVLGLSKVRDEFPVDNSDLVF